MKKLLLLISVYGSIMTMSPDEAIKEIEQVAPHQIEEGNARQHVSPHHHLSIIIDRDTSATSQVDVEISSSRMKYKLALVAAISTLISAALTATVTVFTTKSCP